jgi:hypothetical protein
VHLSVSLLAVLTSPLCEKVGFHQIAFEDFSGFTFVKARKIAQPDLMVPVTRL